MPRLLPCLLLGGLILALPVPRAASDDIDEAAAARTVATLLEADPGTDVRKVWALSESLAATGKEAIRPLKDSLEGSTLPRRLAIARALLLLEDHTRALQEMKALVQDDAASVELKEAALRVIGREGEAEDAEWLADAVDTTFEPHVKMAMAKALWTLGFASTKGKGKEVLRGYLASEDPDLQAAGALALGEIGAATEAKPILRRLKDEPTERGRSAEFLLRILQMEQVSDRALVPVAPPAPPAGPSSVPAPPSAEPSNEAHSWPLLDEIRNLFRAMYLEPDKVAARDFEDAAAHGLTDALDPNSTYLTPEETGRLLEDLHRDYAGVGAYVSNDPKKQFTISRPIFGGPVYRAGLVAGDVIVRIDGTETAGMEVEQAVRLLKGPPGTKVVVSVFRRGWPEPKDYTLVRSRIVIPSVAYDVLPGKVGFLQILSFSEETAREVGKVLDAFDQQGVEALIVDLRWNGGGYLNAAVDIASEFLPAGSLVVSEKGRPGVYEDRVHRSHPPTAVRRQVPMAVLVNEGTASAAEILSGSLQFHRRARLIGTTTYGKGTVQTTRSLRTRPGEPFTDQFRDVPVSWTDSNGNNRIDAGEAVIHAQRRNRDHDPAEKFEDRNGNGRYDAGEPFEDDNYNRRWDAAEPFEDLDHDGVRDPGGTLKITVAHYLLPDGTWLKRETKVVDGKTKTVGGIAPDVEAEPDPLDIWEVQAQRRLEAEGKVRDYAEGLFRDEPELAQRLARSDRADPALYPGFDDLFRACDTKLERAAVRVIVRWQLRRVMGDSMGRELVGDVVDDPELRAGLIDLFATMRKDIGGVPDLAFVPEYHQRQVERAKALRAKD